MLDVKKIIMCIIAALAVLAGGVYAVYRLVIIPKYIEPVLETASEMLKDSDVQEAIQEVAQELVDSDRLDKSLFKAYTKQFAKYLNGSDEEASQSAASTDDDEQAADDSSNTLVISNSASELGIESINTDPSKVGTTTQKLSDHFVEKDEEEDEDEASEYSMSGSTSSQTANEDIDEETQFSSSSDKEQLLADKIISAMSGHDRTIFYNVCAKADISKLKSLYASQDKESAKAYLHEILSNEEYDEAIRIFMKYSYLLVEDD